VGSGNNAVEQNFDGGEVSGWSADFVGVMDEISTDSKTDAFLLCLCGRSVATKRA
jgi:hypothetical protein